MDICVYVLLVHGNICVKCIIGMHACMYDMYLLLSVSYMLFRILENMWAYVCVYGIKSER